jgi:polysaccharide biosynthesis/export protein
VKHLTTLLPAPLLLGCALVLLSVGCSAPGMKLDAVATREQREMVMSGVKVTLRPLDAQVLKAQVTPASADLRELLAVAPTPYRVGPGDVLLVTVWDHPELSLPLGQFRTDAATGSMVEDDGFLYFPYAGRTKVGGLTVPEVRTSLTSALKPYLRNLLLDVKIILFRSQKVYVDGEVKTPAAFPVTDVPFTLAEAANLAGGFLPTADLSRVQLTRGDRRWTFNFMDLRAQGNRIGKILLQDGDALHVAHRDEAPVFLMGEVHTPRSLPLYHGHISLAQALSDAGGINETSAHAGSIYVLRRTGENMEVFHLDGRNPVSMLLADRFQLQARDVVYVDAGTLVRFSRVMNLIMPTVSALTTTAYEIKYLTHTP